MVHGAVLGRPAFIMDCACVGGHLSARSEIVNTISAPKTIRMNMPRCCICRLPRLQVRANGVPSLGRNSVGKWPEIPNACTNYVGTPKDYSTCTSSHCEHPIRVRVACFAVVSWSTLVFRTSIQLGFSLHNYIPP